MTKRARSGAWFLLILASVLLLAWYREVAWPIARHHPGLVAVLVGVAGEVALEWKEMAERRQRLKRIFSSILVLGLAWEFIEAAEADRQVAGLESANLTLRKQVVELELKLQWRRITTDQVRKFTSLTSEIEKIPIKIVIGREGRDTETFAHDLREMFTYAGFKTNPDAEELGVNRLPNFIDVRKFGITDEVSDVTFMAYCTNGMVSIPRLPRWHPADPPIHLMVHGTNQLEIFSAVRLCFEQIGITTEWECDSTIVKPGECLIWVPVK